MNYMKKTGLKKAPNQLYRGPASIRNNKKLGATRLIDNRSATALQRKLIHGINNAPHRIVQRQIMADLANSPQMIIQRQLLERSIQRVEEDEELLQAKSNGATTTPSVVPSNETGMPDRLKSGIESLSGLDMSNVRVHRSSNKPAQLNALAYAQGNNIHLSAGQEHHLPHEAWHVVQQQQGRVKPTMQMAGEQINDDVRLEKEADVMGGKASTWSI